MSVVHFFSMKLKPRDVLDKYDEEIGGKKKDKFLLGILPCTLNYLLVLLHSCLFYQTGAFATSMNLHHFRHKIV